MATLYQQALSKAIANLIPMVSLDDATVIKEIARRDHLRHLPVPVAVWLATTTHIRHNHTDYDRLLNEGYDSDSARFFVLNDMNDILRQWQSTRQIDPNEDELQMIRQYKRSANDDLIDMSERE